MYIFSNAPYGDQYEFTEIHMQPYCIAVSAALLYYDFLRKAKLKINIRGETNKGIPVYKSISRLSKKINKDNLTPDALWDYGFSEDLFKYLTARYSISVSGLSEFDSSQVGAAAHLKIKLKKIELQKEAYEKLKDMSVKDATHFIRCFCYAVKKTIDIPSYPEMHTLVNIFRTNFSDCRDQHSV